MQLLVAGSVPLFPVMYNLLVTGNLLQVRTENSNVRFSSRIYIISTESLAFGSEI